MEKDTESRDDKLDDLDRQDFAIAGDLAPFVITFIKVNNDDVVLP